MNKRNVVIIGAAGRDFHNFNTFFRNKEEYNVVAFTAAQIPDIDGRKYPAAGRKALPKWNPKYRRRLPPPDKEKNVHDCVSPTAMSSIRM